jgi:hypothetical protein
MKYRINVDVLEAYGWQQYVVEADSPEEALEKHNAGESEYDDQELEVYKTGVPKLCDVSKVELV